jgi:acyl-CoA thioesterase
MDPTLSPREIYNVMMQHDAFSDWLGLELDEVGAGYCKMHFTIRREMLNGFSTTHGGVIFAAADSAFAFACNSHGMLTVALDVHIVYTKATTLGDLIDIEARELSRGNKTGVYEIRITRQNELIALFRGTAYQTSKTVASLK